MAGTRNFYTFSANITKLIPLPIKKRDLTAIRSVGIAHGLDGSDDPVPVGRVSLHPYIPVLGPTQPPIQRVKGFSRG